MFTRSGDQIEIATFRALRRANSSINEITNGHKRLTDISELNYEGNVITESNSIANRLNT